MKFGNKNLNRTEGIENDEDDEDEGMETQDEEFEIFADDNDWFLIRKFSGPGGDQYSYVTPDGNLVRVVFDSNKKLTTYYLNSAPLSF